MILATTAHHWATPALGYLILALIGLGIVHKLFGGSR